MKKIKKFKISLALLSALSSPILMQGCKANLDKNTSSINQTTPKITKNSLPSEAIKNYEIYYYNEDLTKETNQEKLSDYDTINFDPYLTTSLYNEEENEINNHKCYIRASEIIENPNKTYSIRNLYYTNKELNTSIIGKYKEEIEGIGALNGWNICYDKNKPLEFQTKEEAENTLPTSHINLLEYLQSTYGHKKIYKGKEFKISMVLLNKEINKSKTK